MLLNSACEKFPAGLANSRDLVGRYLHGHSNLSLIGYLKELIGRAPANDDGATDHSYVPRYDHRRGSRAYKGGFGIQVQFASQMYPRHAKAIGGFGRELKSRVRELQPAVLQMGGFGKVEARPENRVTVDANQTDRHGIPIPVVEFTFSDNDRAVFRAMVEEMREIYDAAGTELLLGAESRIGGFASHEVGTCRMGQDAKTSVLNSYCQAHEILNLFVVDGSCFTTFPEKNPTLTIMALAVRSARFIASQRRKGNL